MIPRERAAAREAEAVAVSAGGRQLPAHPKGDPGAPRNRVPVWEDLYQAIPPEQQRELLSLAGRQGVLYAHQLPVTTNGTASSHPFLDVWGARSLPDRPCLGVCPPPGGSRRTAGTAPPRR